MSHNNSTHSEMPSNASIDATTSTSAATTPLSPLTTTTTTTTTTMQGESTTGAAFDVEDNYLSSNFTTELDSSTLPSTISTVGNNASDMDTTYTTSAMSTTILDSQSPSTIDPQNVTSNYSTGGYTQTTTYFQTTSTSTEISTASTEISTASTEISTASTETTSTSTETLSTSKTTYSSTDSTSTSTLDFTSTATEETTSLNWTSTNATIDDVTTGIPSEPPSTINVGLIVGCSIGAVILLTLIIVLIVGICRRRKNRYQHKSLSTNDSPSNRLPPTSYFEEGLRFQEGLSSPFTEEDLDGPDVAEINGSRTGILRIRDEDTSGGAGPRALQAQSRYSVGPMFLDSDENEWRNLSDVNTASTFKA